MRNTHPTDGKNYRTYNMVNNSIAFRCTVCIWAHGSGVGFYA